MVHFPENTAPSEADGWRVVQDPYYPNYYFRYRALELEVARWWGFIGEWGAWSPALGWWMAEPEAEERRRRWAKLFTNP